MDCKANDCADSTGESPAESRGEETADASAEVALEVSSPPSVAVAEEELDVEVDVEEAPNAASSFFCSAGSGSGVAELAPRITIPKARENRSVSLHFLLSSCV